MQKTGLCLFLFIIMAVLFFTPLMGSCTASTSEKELSETQNRNKTEADDETGKTDTDASDCVRNEPEPVLKKSTFKQLSRFTAEEEFSLNKAMARTLRDQAKNVRSYVYDTELPVSETEFLSFDVKPAAGNSTEIIVLYQVIL